MTLKCSLMRMQIQFLKLFKMFFKNETDIMSESNEVLNDGVQKNLSS